jgi:hypothetical protein
MPAGILSTVTMHVLLRGGLSTTLGWFSESLQFCKEMQLLLILEYIVHSLRS